MRSCNKNDSYKIANLSDTEKNYIREAEQKVKAETGKDVVMVGWEKN